MSDHWIKLFETSPIQDLKPGEILFRRGDTVERIYLVKKGRIRLERALKDGGLLTLHIANLHELVAEASLFADQYHCDGATDLPTSVAILPRATVLGHLSENVPIADLTMGAFKRMARDLQSLRTRVEIMRLRRVADRLDAYIELYGLPEPGGWVHVADWIGASPPALYRELARRRGGTRSKTS